MLNNMSLLSIVLSIPAILIAFTFHEYAHAIVADRLGDKTPRFQGRITLNPLAHIDVIGFIMILVVGFGWAKPVQTNPTAFKRYYKDHIKVAAAGPLANLLVAIVFAAIYVLCIVFLFKGSPASTIYGIIESILFYIIRINMMLFIFNLLPIPGLDGYHILRDLFPSTFNKLGYKMQRYEFLILILFIATPISSYVVGIPSYWLSYRIIGMIGGLFI